MKRTLALAGILILVGCSPKPTPSSGGTPEKILPNVKVLAAAKGLQQAPERFSASVTPYTQVKLKFNSAGYVSQIKQTHDVDGTMRWVQAGDQIHTGEELAELRATEYQANVAKADATLGQALAQVQDATGSIHGAEASTEQARAGVRQAEAALREAQANVADLEAALQAAKAGVIAADAEDLKCRLAWERATALYATGSMTKPEYDTDKANHETAAQKAKQARDQVSETQAKLAQGKAQVSASQAKLAEAHAQVSSAVAQEERAQASLSGAQSQVKGAQGNLEEANVKLGDISLKSPLDGVIINRKIDIGQQVDKGADGFEVADLGSVRVTFGVPDVMIKNLKMGQDLKITTDAIPGRVFHGRIVTIPPEADPQSLVYKVEVKVPNKDGKLTVGMTMSLDLSTAASHANPIEVPMVPDAAMTVDRLNPNVFIVKIVESANGTNTVHERRVRRGKAVGDQVQILEGLNIGDKVIVDGANMVREGDLVRIQE